MAYAYVYSHLPTPTSFLLKPCQVEGAQRLTNNKTKHILEDKGPPYSSKILTFSFVKSWLWPRKWGCKRCYGNKEHSLQIAQSDGGSVLCTVLQWHLRLPKAAPTYQPQSNSKWALCFLIDTSLLGDWIFTLPAKWDHTLLDCKAGLPQLGPRLGNTLLSK